MRGKRIMGWFSRNKINSDEYIDLLKQIQKLRIEVESLNLDLQLYAKKLKTSRGLTEKSDLSNNEKFNNPVLLPE